MPGMNKKRSILQYNSGLSAALVLKAKTSYRHEETCSLFLNATSVVLTFWIDQTRFKSSHGAFLSILAETHPGLLWIQFFLGKPYVYLQNALLFSFQTFLKELPAQIQLFNFMNGIVPFRPLTKPPGVQKVFPKHFPSPTLPTFLKIVSVGKITWGKLLTIIDSFLLHVNACTDEWELWRLERCILKIEQPYLSKICVRDKDRNLWQVKMLFSSLFSLSLSWQNTFLIMYTMLCVQFPMTICTFPYNTHDHKICPRNVVILAIISQLRKVKIWHKTNWRFL